MERATLPAAAGEGPEGHESPFIRWLVQTSYLLLSQHGYGHVVLPPAVTEGAARLETKKPLRMPAS